MIIKILLTISLIVNLFFFKKKISKFLRDKRIGSKIPTVSITEINDDFKFEKIADNLSVPKQQTLVKSTFYWEGSFHGITAEYETWIMSVIAKKSTNIFEFGTASGKTTYLLAENSPESCKIITVTLDEKNIKDVSYENNDNSVAKNNAIKESIYKKFFFTGRDCEKKIKVIFVDSKKLKIDNFIRKFDLIFIDGGHTYSYVKNDSEKAFQMIKKGGYILWHDFNIGKKSCKDVVKYLEENVYKKKIYHIKNTSLCFYQKN